MAKIAPEIGSRMDIILKTNTEDPHLSLKDIRRFDDGSGFGLLFVVRSHGFSAHRQFSFERHCLLEFVEAVENMDRKLSGSARLAPMFEDEIFFELTIDVRGRVTVQGEVNEFSDLSQKLRFAFETDQTCLAPLAADLRVCLNQTPA